MKLQGVFHDEEKPLENLYNYPGGVIIEMWLFLEYKKIIN